LISPPLLPLLFYLPAASQPSKVPHDTPPVADASTAASAPAAPGLAPKSCRTRPAAASITSPLPIRSRVARPRHTPSHCNLPRQCDRFVYHLPHHLRRSPVLACRQSLAPLPASSPIYPRPHPAVPHFLTVPASEPATLPQLDSRPLYRGACHRSPPQITVD
jgi:hypothetical protein